MSFDEYGKNVLAKADELVRRREDEVNRAHDADYDARMRHKQDLSDFAGVSYYLGPLAGLFGGGRAQESRDRMSATAKDWELARTRLDDALVLKHRVENAVWRLGAADTTAERDAALRSLARLEQELDFELG